MDETMTLEDLKLARTVTWVFLVAFVASLYSVYLYAAQELGIADEHPDDVAKILIWVIGGLSGALFLLISLIARLLLNRFDRLEAQLAHVAEEIENDISQIRAKVQELDARLSSAETKIIMYHEG